MKSNTIWQPLLTTSAYVLGAKMFICDKCRKIPKKTPCIETGITGHEVAEIQKQWGESLVNIGRVFSEGGDYRKAALDHVERFYAYDNGIVLFKPTMAEKKQFRTDKKSALSYFIGDCDDCPEDHGFALKKWKAVRWENVGTIIKESISLAMGNYYFTPVDGTAEVKVEYSFAYMKDKKGDLRIILHDSHIPYHHE